MLSFELFYNILLWEVTLLHTKIVILCSFEYDFDRRAGILLCFIAQLVNDVTDYKSSNLHVWNKIKCMGSLNRVFQQNACEEFVDRALGIIFTKVGYK